jgi:hypothetical protein
MPVTHYVILFHDGLLEPHYDLMFQTQMGGMLSTWRLPVWRPTGPTEAQKLPDHRQAYLTFEGEISGGRGTVRRVEHGICHAERCADGGWNVLLETEPIGEEFVLRLKPISGERWLCELGKPNSK